MLVIGTYDEMVMLAKKLREYLRQIYHKKDSSHLAFVASLQVFDSKLQAFANRWKVNVLVRYVKIDPQVKIAKEFGTKWHHINEGNWHHAFSELQPDEAKYLPDRYCEYET